MDGNGRARAYMDKVHWLHERKDVASDAEFDLCVMAKK